MPLSSAQMSRRRQIRLDNWSNAVTGLGTTRDKSYFNEFIGSGFMAASQLENLYLYNDIVAVICEAYPEECFKKGILLKGDNRDSVLESFASLNVVQKFTDAAVWANVFGGAVIYIGTSGTKDTSLPLMPGSEIIYLNVFDARELSPQTYYTDFNSRKCGLPETFLVNNYGKAGAATNKVVHESRLLIFDGLRVTNYQRSVLSGWGQSLIQRAYDSIQSFGVGFGVLSHLINDANQAVFGMQNYTQSIERGDIAIIKTRLEGMDTSRSAVRALVMDKEDTFHRENFSWSGMKEPFVLLMERLSAAVKIPVTILMGRSPAGQNATGESDFRGFYDRVNSRQEQVLIPLLNSLLSLLDKTKTVSVSFPPSLALTPTEQANLQKVVADTDAIYIDRGILQAEEIQQSRFGSDGWADGYTVDVEMRERVRDAELQATSSTDLLSQEPVEKQALNGIQIKSLKELLQEYAAPENKLSAGQVRAIIEISFPGLSQEQISRLVP